MSASKEMSLATDILLVDDDQDFRWVMSDVLNEANYSVLQAQDGKEALKLLEKDIPGLILLDYRMPGRDGLLLVEDIKKLIR